MRNLFAFDQIREVRGLARLGEYQARSGEQRADQSGARERKVVLGRKRDQDSRVGGETGRGGGLARVVEIVGMSTRYQLRHPGGAAGKQEQSDVERITRRRSNRARYAAALLHRYASGGGSRRKNKVRLEFSRQRGVIEAAISGRDRN